ncbi:hypothetical protein ACFL5P_01300 [candidate division KSB1 bacterium]
MKKITLTIFAALLIAQTGCHDHPTIPVDLPPAPPSGLYSVTGNGKATLYWDTNFEPDLREFALYSSTEEFGAYVLEGTTTNTYFTYYFPNGSTRYLAVAAIDLAGNESELSYETIWETPRPEGFNKMVYALFYDSTQTNFDRCGIDFSDYNSYMIQALDNPSNDVYIDNYEGVVFLNAFAEDTDIALFGLTSDISDIDYIDPELIDWAEDGYVPLYEDFSYVIWTYDNHFATIRIEEVFYDRVLFDWAYQTDEGNPQLKTSAAGNGKNETKSESERKLRIRIPKTIKQEILN